ncbi:hypothetical protein LXL04_004882 [Taraxacum kok-saghyz]
MAMLSPSMAVMKRKGERGSPCLTPFVILNSFVFPFTKTEARADSRHPYIHILHFPPNPICIRVESRNPQLTESNALSKSTLNSRIFFFDFFAQAHVSLTMRGPSRMFLPSTYADCTSSMQLPITFFRREANSFEQHSNIPFQSQPPTPISLPFLLHRTTDLARHCFLPSATLLPSISHIASRQSFAGIASFDRCFFRGLLLLSFDRCCFDRPSSDASFADGSCFAIPSFLRRLLRRRLLLRQRLHPPISAPPSSFLRFHSLQMLKKQTVFLLQTADVWTTSSSAELCRCGPQTADTLF